jgi:hypothetical protein
MRSEGATLPFLPKALAGISEGATITEAANVADRLMKFLLFNSFILFEIKGY